MKIEIGESLLYSWLRHIKKCQLVQMNWKASTNSWEMKNKDSIQELMEATDDYLLINMTIRFIKGQNRSRNYYSKQKLMYLE